MLQFKKHYFKAVLCSKHLEIETNEVVFLKYIVIHNEKKIKFDHFEGSKEAKTVKCKTAL